MLSTPSDGHCLSSDAEDSAHKLYDRNIRNTKADLLAYERQKEAALGLAPGTLVPANATSLSIKQSGGSAGSSKARGLTLAEDLYRGADTLSYGDSKPSEEAVDRVTAKINKECVTFLPHTRALCLVQSRCLLGSDKRCEGIGIEKQ